MSLDNITDYFQTGLWRQTHYDSRSRSRSWGVSTLQVLTLCVRGFIGKDLNTRANSLTYSLMFAIVPIMSIVLAIAEGFGFANVVEDKLNDSFLGEYNVVPLIMEMVHHYLDTAQGGVFLGVGLLILLWAVYSFFQNVETAFNDIWNVDRSRSIMRQVVTYLAIVMLIPILIIVSSGLFTAATNFLTNGHLAWLHFGVTALLPYFTTWVIFSWMYHSIPNTKVHFLSAVIPGIVAGTCFQVLQWALVHFVVILSRTSIVYGAFAIVPIFLMCVQWMCLLILIGAQLSFAIQNNELFEYEQDINSISSRYERFLTLCIMRLIIERFDNALAPFTAHEIAAEYKIPLRLVNKLLAEMVRANLIREVYVEGKEDRTYQPALSIHHLTIGMVTDRLDSLGSEDFLRTLPDEVQQRWQSYCRLRDEHNTLTAIPIQQL